MAGEIITTTLTASYEVQTGDEVYVSRSGEIIMNSGSNHALYALASINAIKIVVDGAVIATSGALSNPYGIRLSGGSETTNVLFDILVGETGMVRSLYGRAIDLTGSGATVRNDGQVSSGSTGIAVTGSDGVVTNSGRVLAHTGLQIWGSDNVVLNAGLIDATSAGAWISGTGSLTNTGKIAGADYGVWFDQYGGILDLTLSNAGTISGDDGLHVGGLSNLSLFAVEMVNSGAILGIAAGIRSDQGAEVRLSNTTTGLVSASEGSAIDVTGILTLTNAGTIAGAGGAGAAIRLGGGSGSSSVTNHGIIQAAGDLAIDASALVDGAGLFVTNHGTIAGAYSGAGVSDFVKNFGTMAATSTAGGIDTVRNAGLIDGDVLLGSEADSYRGALGRVEGYVDGGTGRDTLLGGGDDDDLRGGTGSDSLAGRGGDDLLAGGAGSDVLRGGAGADSFRFASAAEAGLGATADVIADFEHLVDQIDLSAFMGGAAFIGSATFTATGAEIRYTKTTGLLEGDADGNGTADWSLVLQNRPTLSAGDLVL